MAIYNRRLLETGAIVDRILNRTGSDDSSYHTTTSQFDTNMVIILAVLLCALIIALALNFIAPCGLRYIFNNRSHEPTPASVPGLKKRALLKLPEGVFRTGPDILVTECSICLEEFVDGERVRVLPICSHGFHFGCIDRWLMSHASCPNCRISVLETPPGCTV